MLFNDEYIGIYFVIGTISHKCTKCIQLVIDAQEIVMVESIVINVNNGVQNNCAAILQVYTDYRNLVHAKEIKSISEQKQLCLTSFNNRM